MTDIPQKLQPVVDFHGHLCPGLLIGYRACLAAQDKLPTPRSIDEELVCVVENDSCSVDAVQFMTGCTFGKGNLIFRDFGKQVFTFIRRPDGAGVRVAFIGDRTKHPSRQAKVAWLIEAPDEELIKIESVEPTLPPQAGIHKTITCNRCGEGVMETRTMEVDGRRLCLPCASETNVGEEADA